MTGQNAMSTDQRVADYVRATVRVQVPDTLVAEVMRSAAATPQVRRPWYHAFWPAIPAASAVAAMAVVIALGILVSSPRQTGPAPGATEATQPTQTPAPTLTPQDARVLTEPGDEIRIPALDGEGQFGTITIRRGEERAGYDGFVPFAFTDVFFVEVYVRYEPTRFTAENYGEWEFAYAVDADGDGFDEEDVLQREPGFLGMEGEPGYESAPAPMLGGGQRSGAEVLEGWLVLQLPASVAAEDVYLVYGHGEWTDGIQNLVPDASALLRGPGEPVGVTAFDPEAFGSPDPSAAMPSFHSLPTPMPSAEPTFEPVADEAADALFDETQTCTNADLGVTVEFPAAWHTNEAGEGTFGEPIEACALFSESPIDEPALLFQGLVDQPFVLINERPAGEFGIEEPTTERVPIGERVAWRISWQPEQMSYGTSYLVPVGDDPYGPFIAVGALDDALVPVLDRIIARLQFTE